MSFETFTKPIATQYMASAMDKINKMNRKLKKMGLPVIQFSFGQTRNVPCDKDAFGAFLVDKRWVRQVVDLIVSGQRPCINGWKIVAVVKYDRGSKPMVFTLDGNDYHSHIHQEADCDHCNTKRRRDSAFLVKDENGSLMQIGSACVKQYDSDKTLFAELNFWKEFINHSDEDCEWLVRSDPTSIDLLTALKLISAEVRKNGFVSSAYAPSTKSKVVDVLAGRSKSIEIDSNDVEMAMKVSEWLKDEFDPNKEHKSDFAQNVSAALEEKEGQTQIRVMNLGMICWAVTGYQRHMEKQQALKQRKPGSTFDRVWKHTAQVVSIRQISSDYGISDLVKLTDQEGNHFSFFTSKKDINVGMRLEITGHVKSSKEFNGVIENQITRCKYVILP